MRPPRLRLTIPSLALLVVLALGLGAVVWLILRDDSATSEEGGPVAQLDRSPLPFYGYPATVEPPDTENPPKCLYPDDERVSPDLPPLSCRHEANEPPPGAIDTPSPKEIPDKTTLEATAPAGWTVIDNALLRLTLAIPPGWYSNMRPEGGEFMLSDPVAVEEQLKGSNPPGGVILFFSAHAYRPSSGPFKSIFQEHLDAPTTQFGPYPGAIWDEGPGEGLSHTLSGLSSPAVRLCTRFAPTLRVTAGNDPRFKAT